jgi:hypothetical protein
MEDANRRRSHELRTAGLSAFGGFIAPLVFVAVLVLRKVNRRLHFRFRFLNQRLKRELARWS